MTQQAFFEKIIAEKKEVTAFLVNGIKLIGKITEHNDKSFLLERDNVTQLVNKHAVSTIMPVSNEANHNK
jgi:host factor-I protein